MQTISSNTSQFIFSVSLRMGSERANTFKMDGYDVPHTRANYLMVGIPRAQQLHVQYALDGLCFVELTVELPCKLPHGSLNVINTRMPLKQKPYQTISTFTFFFIYIYSVLHLYTYIRLLIAKTSCFPRKPCPHLRNRIRMMRLYSVLQQ